MPIKLILCAFLITCFDKIIDNELCAKGCVCYIEPNGEISATCDGQRGNSIDSEFKTKALSSLALTKFDKLIDFEHVFPVKQTVKNLIISNSASNLWSTEQNNLFKHIENTKYLTFNEIHFFGWKWDLLANSLFDIEGIHIQRCTFDTIPEIIGQISRDKVIMLSLIDTNFNLISTRAFDWPNLKKITITDNKIPKLNRQWFSHNLNNLRSLDLQRNSINEIPDGFFNGMPNLRQLKLSHNQIRVLKWDTVQPIWNNLHEFWIHDNLIECNAHLVWITKEIKRPLFFDDGQCRHPGKTHDKIFFHSVHSPIDIDPLATYN